jgi:hypothetical protein
VVVVWPALKRQADRVTAAPPRFGPPEPNGRKQVQ